MIVRRTWKTITRSFGVVQRVKEYNMLLLFGIIPIYIHIDG